MFLFATQLKLVWIADFQTLHWRALAKLGFTKQKLINHIRNLLGEATYESDPWGRGRPERDFG